MGKKQLTREELEELVSMLLNIINDKDLTITLKDYKIDTLEAEVKRLEELLTPTIKDTDKPLID